MQSSPLAAGRFREQNPFSLIYQRFTTMNDSRPSPPAGRFARSNHLGRPRACDAFARPHVAFREHSLPFFEDKMELGLQIGYTMTLGLLTCSGPLRPSRSWRPER